MTTYTKCKTQRQAIAEAKQVATENTDVVAKVITVNGDTLRITSDENGNVTTQSSSGWDRQGIIFCGPRAYAAVT